MAKKIVVFNQNVTAGQKEQILRTAEKYGYEVGFQDASSVDPVQIGKAEIMFGAVPSILKYAGSLKWLCLSSAGANLFTVPDILPEECLLSNSSGAYGVTLAEHMIMQTLMMFRKMPQFQAGIREKQWMAPVPQKSIKDARITILGAGDIGKCYARRLKSFEPADITAVSRSGRSDEPSFDRVLPLSELNAVLPETDLLAMCLPETKDTIGILSKERIALLRADAYLLNVGRGSAVDEEALVQALNSGKLAGAALDVTCSEPPREDSPLWSAKNLILTPHVAGNMTVPYTRQKSVEMFCEDLINYCTGKKLRYLVDRKLGY